MLIFFLELSSLSAMIIYFCLWSRQYYCVVRFSNTLTVSSPTMSSDPFFLRRTGRWYPMERCCLDGSLNSTDWPSVVWGWRKVGREMWGHVIGAYWSLNGPITEDQIFECPHGPNKCCCSDWKNHSFQYQLTANTSSFQLPIGTTMASDDLLQASWWTKGFNYIPDCPTPGARRPPSSKQLNHGFNCVPDCPTPGARRPPFSSHQHE